jgi:predicted ATPase/class 3 adenylate cyclase
MPELPTGTVTFLFSDIEGSTLLLQRVGGERYAQVLGEHQRLMRGAWTAHGGVEVDTQGDSFFVAFPSAPQAVTAAAEATEALAVHAWPEGAAIRVRIGLHTGAPALAGGNYVGLDVHRAARIAAAGHGGQVLLSQATRDLAEHELPEGAVMRDLGAHRLKDLQHAERLYQLMLPGLPSDFPPLKSLDARPHNLPVQLTALLGREQVLAAVCALLRRVDVRLVTLTGPGGIGKTRLSLQVAAEVLDDFQAGVWFVRLSRLMDPDLVVPTIAQMLELREQGTRPIAETLREHLRDRHLLLVLDNFEQVVGAAPEVSALLESAPNVKMLVTSRVALHVRGEREYAAPPLRLPDVRRERDVAVLTQYEAVALFVERAQAARADFQVTAANAPAIAEICARLDGLPLAIELAAARVKVLPPEALLGRLSNRLQLLTGGPRDLEARQQTMRATIDWSEDLLQPAGRVLFRRLAVFVGGCTLEAAEAVCSAPEGAEPLEIDLLDGLGALVDQSLVQQHEVDGEPRFSMLHVIREYAMQRLEASGEVEALRRAHTAYFVALAEHVEPWLFMGPRLREALGLLGREYDNMRAALGWTLQAGEGTLGLRLAGATSRYWFYRARGTHVPARPSEGRQWLEGLLALQAPGGTAGGPGSPGADHDAALQCVRAKALSGAGELANVQGDFGRAESLLEESVALAREAGDSEVMVLALSRLSGAQQGLGDLERATALLEESMAIARRLGDPLLIVIPFHNLGMLAYARGDLDQAEAHIAEVVAINRQTQDTLWLANDLAAWANIRRRQGDLHQAFVLLREAFAVLRATGERAWPFELDSLACALGAAGKGARAAGVLGAAAALRETFGLPQPTWWRADVEQAVAPARAALGEEAWASALVAGHALSLEEAVAEALGEGGEDVHA